MIALSKDIVCEHCGHQPCAKRVPIFSSLDDEEIMQVVSLITRREYSKGEMIIIQGDLSRSLIIIHSGKIKTFRYTADGREQILYIFQQGDFFGEMNLLYERGASYNAQAIEDCRICIIHRDGFQKLLQRYPSISLKIIEELCNRLDKMENMVESMSSNDAELRVNEMLLEFSRKYGREHPEGRLVELPLSREGMANYIGVARETVSRKLVHLQDEGIIRLEGNKRLFILDEKALQR